MLGVGARKFIAEPAVESRRPKAAWKQGERERGYLDALLERERNGWEREIRKVGGEGGTVNERLRRKNNGEGGESKY